MTSETLSGDENLVLPEFDLPPTQPLELLQRWIEAAERIAVREPRAATLSTTDGAKVSSRTILVKEIATDQIIFGTHTGSRKGRNLRTVPYASLTFYWRETLQQMNLAGAVEQLDAAASDRLFADRTRAAQAAAAVSQQGAPLTDENTLKQAIRDLLDTGAEIPRPENWSGYALRPDEVEFWYGRTDRVHRRLSYTQGTTGWDWARLQP